MGGRAVILDAALQPYAKRGWSVDERSDGGAIVSKELGPGYLLYGLFGLLLPDREGRRENTYKRRLITVDARGTVSVKRLPWRGDRASRYAR